ncbi:MAG TPA: TetR/AcrR family transcriptional regulator [Anaerolineaceae bacterium]|nr:TetR/AcrR family transcriptional regulator [Anaerolineaceae bacterium]
MVRLKQADRQQAMDGTRRRLLDAAADEFSRSGFSGANINAISTLAGFAKGTVYNYFPSKRALMLVLVDEIARQHFVFIQAKVLTVSDPASRLQLFYQAGFEFITTFLSKARIAFNVINGTDEEFKAAIFTAYQPMFAFLAEEILVPGMKQDMFRSMEPVQTAMLLMTIYLGTASQLNDQGRPWLDPGQVSSLILNGLRK